MKTLSAVLIVKNEEKKLESCLASLRWADEIIIVDTHSTDRTLEIASRYTDKIYQRDFDEFSAQKNFAVEQASGEWILSVDADERVSPELRDAIIKVLEKGTGYDGFMVKRRNIIFGKSLRFAGQRSEKILRLFRKGGGLFEQPIHEKVAVNGPVGELAGELVHESITDLKEYFEKLNLYTDHEARLMRSRGIRPNFVDLYLKPAARFFYFYILRLGFLDGYAGFLYHGLSSYYAFLKCAKVKELQWNKPETSRV